MEARELLETVAQTYAGLESLSVDILVAHESHSEDGSNSNTQRARSFYAAPDKVRIEPGRRGVLRVCNGTEVFHHFGRAPRYSRSILQPGHLPGAFRPESPLGNEAAFLFSRIAERVVAAEILREQPASGEDSTACYVVSVTYEPFPHPWVTGSRVVFRVNSRTHLVTWVSSETTRRMPQWPDETHIDKITLTFGQYIVDEPISPETFEFVPPEDATELSPPPRPGGGMGAGGGIGIGGGIGNAGPGWHFRRHPGKGDGPVGGTQVQHSRQRLGGVDVAFERRMTVSDDGSELRIVERITGPKGDTEHEISVPLT